MALIFPARSAAEEFSRIQPSQQLDWGTFIIGSGQVTAKENVSAEEAGVNDQVSKLLDQQKFDQAHQVLEENGVQHDSDKTVFRKDFNPDDNEEGDVSTDAVFNKGSSSVHLNGWHKYGKVYRARVDADLSWGNGSPIDSQGPPDGYGISFAGSRWESDGNYNGKDIRNSYAQPEGIVAKVKPQVNPSAGSFTYHGRFASDIEKRGSNRHNVYGHYGHTWAAFGVPVGASFSIAFGVLSISVGGGDSWTIRAPRIEI